MSPYKRNLVTGLVVLIALGVLGWMVLTFSGRAMGIFRPKGTPVTFLSDGGNGLSEGSPVYYRGVQVGKVTALKRDPDNIHVSIDGEIQNVPPLPQNVQGQIKTQSQLSSQTQIELQLEGTAPQGALTANQQIRIKYSGSSIFPPEAIELLEDARRQELVRHVDEAIVSLRKQVEKVGTVADSVQTLLGDQKMQNDLRQAVANIRLVSERANKIGANLDTLTTNANATITKTNDNLDHLTQQISGNLDKLGVTFRQFQEISEKINNGHGTAGALINDPKLYDEMAMTAKELNVVAASLARLVDQWEKEGVSLKLAK